MMLRVRKYPIALLTLEKLSVFRCLHFLDRQCRNIYIMGEDNIFSGTGFTRNQIIRGYYKRNEICSWQGNPIEIGSLPISVLNKYSHAQQAEFLQHLSENFPDQEEFPVLDEEGRIVYVIEKQEEQTHINWEKISFPEELKKYKKIYLSSLGSDNLLGFFQRFRKDVEMQVLSEDNLDDALRDGVILYELDGLPECSKVNLLEAVKRNEKMLQEKARQVEEEARRKKEEAERPRREAEAKKREKEIKKILPLVHITNKWAAIKENELQDMSQLIEKFDEGYHTVSIIDSEYNFKCLVDLRIFKEDFPKKDFRIIDDLWVEWNDNEEELKRKIAEMVFADLERKEIPILHNGKIVSLGRFTDYFDMDGNWDSRQVYAFDWDWINEDVAREFFLNRRKLLISSRHGFLKGFIEKFSSWLDITVYEDCLLEECIADHFDLILCGSGYFNSFSAEKWNAHELFIMLLLETVRRWLAKQGVSFHFFSYDPDIPNIESRLSNENELIGGTKGYLREGASPYFIVDGSEYDRVQECNKKMPNYHSGIRYGVESQMRGNRICFFGACVVIGFATYSPYKTIESFLQNIVNADVKPYQVINYGTEGVMLNSNYFNWLYRLMDTPFTCGDIVVVFGRYYSFWGRDNRFAPYNRHLMSSPFLEPGNIDKKCFRDPFIAHMDTTGYEIMSRYVKKSIENDFATRVYKKDGICFMKDKVMLSPYSSIISFR